jgi:cytoskeletal protein CcmA (bactofilin family)
MEQNAQHTVIGESVVITGQIRGDEDLLILGRVEGTIILPHQVEIDESAVVKADINAREIILSGIVVGNITATEGIRITASGRLIGNVTGANVVIEPGARVRGQVHAGHERQVAALAPVATKVTQIPKPAVREAPREPAAPHVAAAAPQHRSSVTSQASNTSAVPRVAAPRIQSLPPRRMVTHPVGHATPTYVTAPIAARSVAPKRHVGVSPHQQPQQDLDTDEPGIAAPRMVSAGGLHTSGFADALDDDSKRFKKKIVVRKRD